MPKSEYRIALLPGDGVGPEVVASARSVLDAAATSNGIAITYETYEAGVRLYQQTGQGISADTMERIGEADAILLGAMGLPGIRKTDGTEVTPQIEIREHYKLFASLRPARLFDGVEGALRRGAVDMLVIRETTEGLFAGRLDPQGDDPDSASDRLTFTRSTSEKLFELAFVQARLRRAAGGRGKVTLLDKANVLSSFAFLRSIFDEVAARNPDVPTERLYIDSACMLMVLDPERFDVVVTENQFGDIVSEIGAGITGGLGLQPSADVGDVHAMFQPCHGSAPDISGKGIANPIATILSTALMMEWLAERYQDMRAAAVAAKIREAVARVLIEGPRTADLGGNASTDEITAAIVAALAPTVET